MILELQVVNKLLSIIIPTYNNENSICDCIDSILEQKYLKNVEIIVINDGSTDNTKKKLKRYIVNNDILLINQSNNGVSYSRNIGIKKAIGKYIWFIDADDKIPKGSLNYALFKILSENTYDLLMFGFNKVNKNKNTLIVNSFCKGIKKDEFKTTFYKMFSENLIKPVWNKFYLRKFINNNAIKFERIKVGEDAVFNYRVMMKAGNIFILDKIKYIYYVDSSTSSKHTYNKDFLDNAIYRINLLQEMLKKLNVKDDEIINNELLETVVGEEINIFIITNSFTSYSFKLKTGCMKELRKDINIKANNYIKVLLAKSNLLSYIYLKVRFG